MVLVGGGPRTAGLLERLAANRPELLAGALQIHVVEPHTPGAGRIWRYEQHPGLMLNSAAADVTMFTDASVQCEGPAVEGPGLADWAAGVLDGSITDIPELPHELRRQLASLTGSTFPTRQLQSVYLEWFFRRSVAALGPDVTVTVHRDTATAVEPLQGEPDPASQQSTEGYRVRLAGGTVLHADVVIAALGHTDSRPDRESSAWAGFAARHGAFHAAPSYTTDVDYSPLAAGQDVIVSGMGLAFVDLLVLLMEGRGGRFEELPDGGLRYVPSGAEPRLWAGSRRGVPYHSKITSTIRGDAAGEPAFFTAEAVAGLLDAPGELDFRGPAVAPDRQGRRLRVLPRAVRRLPGAGPDRLAGILRTLLRGGLVQPGPPAARRRVRPGRGSSTWTSSGWTIPSRAAPLPATLTSRPPWRRTSAGTWSCAPGRTIRRHWPCSLPCSSPTWTWAGWCRPSD